MRPIDTATPSETTGEPSQVIELHQAVAIIVGIVVGAGIFKAPSLVAGFAGTPEVMFGAWLLGGLISLMGALVYAELATTFPHAGGDYHFLGRAYGRSVAFLFAWARFAVITTGSIVLLAFVFGDYMQTLLPLGSRGAAWHALLAVAVFTVINLRGTVAGARTQSWLTLLEVVGLLLIVMAGWWLWQFNTPGGGLASAAPTATAAISASGMGAFGMAMVFVLLTFGGWNEAAYISAELKDRRRNMLRALLLSIAAITLLYLLVNWAYWRGLGLAGMAASDAIAADLLTAAFGPKGGTVIALLVVVATLTSINATMIVGARTAFAAGREWPALARLGRWDTRRGTPAAALLVQGVASMLLVGAGLWSGGGFAAMVEYTAPVFWLFFLLAGFSVIVLRRREPHRERPFRVPLYPWLPLLFCAVCAYMLWSSLSYVHSQAMGGFNAAWMGVWVLAAGAVVLLLMRRAGTLPSEQATAP